MGGAGPVGDIGVSGGVDHHAREDRLASGFRFRDDPGDAIAFEDRRDEQAMQHRADARLFDEPVGNELEALAVELIGEGLAFRHRCPHRLGAFFEFAADATGLDRGLVPVPGEAFDADRGDVPAETTEALDEAHLDAAARGGESGGEAAGPGADDQNVGAVHDLGRPGRFGDGARVRGHGRVDSTEPKACRTDLPLKEAEEGETRYLGGEHCPNMR